MPRILITGFCPVPGPHRAGVQLGHVMRALSPLYPVDMLVVRRGEQAHLERQGTARILRVPVPEEDGFRAQAEGFRRALRRQLESSEYDIVHFRDSWSGIPTLELRGRLEYATVFDAARAPIADLPSLDLDLAGEIARDEEACVMGADLLVVATEAGRIHARRSRPSRVAVVPPGVDVDRFDWDDAPQGRPLVLYAGTVEPGRGVRVLLRAMVYVSRHIDARLCIAGALTPEFDRALRSAIDELGLSGRVELLGEVDHADMPGLIARATVCVAPTALEPSEHPMAMFPTKLLEYMACRRAVVVPRRSTASLLVESGVNGLAFSPGDPLDLSRKIVRVIEDREARERMAEAGYQLVRQGYAASNTRRALRRAYEILSDEVHWGRKPASMAENDGSGAAVRPSMLVEQLPGEPGSGADLSDTTDEYEVPFVERGGVVPGPQPLGAHAEQRLPTRPTNDSSSWAAMSDPPTQGDLAQAFEDEWIVAEQCGPTSRMPTLWSNPPYADDDSTPIDVVPVISTAPLLENRLVAGEVDVPSVAPEAEDAIRDDNSFVAMKVLVGGLNDGTDGAGTGNPG